MSQVTLARRTAPPSTGIAAPLNPTPLFSASSSPGAHELYFTNQAGTNEEGSANQGRLASSSDQAFQKMVWPVFGPARKSTSAQIQVLGVMRCKTAGSCSPDFALRKIDSANRSMLAVLIGSARLSMAC
jgi:hypothetical protein